VLRHHPDKKAGAAGETNDDSFFKCIAKAHEVLSNPEKRRIFDSADAGVNDDDVPLPSQKLKDAEEFVSLYAPVFEREGRFSKTQPVVQLGGADASKQEVESFYSFWYNFDSWRSFEHFDKDANEGSDSRDEKRYQEKKNKAERARRKKEDIARVRLLVDQSMANDPRIKRIKAEDKAAREAKKRGSRPGTPGGGSAADKEKAAAELKKKEEEEKQKAEEDKKKAESDKADNAAAKKAREAAKKNLKREKKAASTLLTSLNYLLPDGQSPSASHVEAQLTEIDLIMNALDPTAVPDMRKAMEAKKDDREGVKKEVIEWAAKAGKTDLKGFTA
jgi:DnaJ family protein C protein 2